MATVSFDANSPATLRAWAAAYEQAVEEHRFPSDPHAEFFPRDMRFAAGEIEKLKSEINRLKRDLGGRGCP
jgi:hypothetical protein